MRLSTQGSTLPDEAKSPVAPREKGDLMPASITIDEKAKTLTIVLDLTIPGVPSASGKTLVVASTRGNQVTDATINGKNVVIGCNAYIRR